LKEEKVSMGSRKYNGESCIICTVVHIVKVINSRMLQWAEHVTHLWEERN
jgi:hypothetical protein